ncbi:hypothetical protein EJB05_48651 [Eragrostis curvula]|uniref:Uncharacterized protein n=1 Tax=Eragrostis curvula TaxID=38414 RepID=A0A5J9T2C5_9POAL|nr:hypothetical protein EJB05_48651 [Eragrostis curvula]
MRGTLSASIPPVRSFTTPDSHDENAAAAAGKGITVAVQHEGHLAGVVAELRCGSDGWVVSCHEICEPRSSTMEMRREEHPNISRTSKMFENFVHQVKPCGGDIIPLLIPEVD